ncbi:hypothetical protein KACC15558_23840 [Brevibacterium ammoniilyticum]|uniref:Uncharacterized protein n=1 Tax=Brevibacterium ammoniilyticum TaxID=1046555 RepID=A0ABP9U4S7_9MICO
MGPGGDIGKYTGSLLIHDSTEVDHLDGLLQRTFSIDLRRSEDFEIN